MTYTRRNPKKWQYIECESCGKTIVKRAPLHRYCEDCAEPNRLERMRNYKVKTKEQVFSHYSNGSWACACCGENHREFLTIHHTEGNGADHRREIIAGRKARNPKIRWENSYTGNTFYAWLKKNNFPEGYQVLCFNCNASRQYSGYCPHEKERSV